MNLRNVDAEQLVRLGDVLDILNELTTELSDEKAMLEGPIWNADDREYDPATPAQVLSNAQDRVGEAREQIMWLLQ
jgi:hypothetical protein